MTSVQAGGGENTIHSAEHTGSDIQSDTSVFAEAVSQQESQSAVHSENSSHVSQSGSSTQATHTSSPGEHTHTQGGGESTPNQGNSGQPSHSSTHITHQTSIGGAVFARSLASGGRFANDVIGTVARGDTRSTGSITGDLAAQSLSSYMGHTALGAGARNIPRYSDVEIGGGRITGMEYKPGSQEGLAFGMYHAGQYAAPEGPHQKVHSADGALWFKQYAQDAVERKPYKAPDGTVAYSRLLGMVCDTWDLQGFHRAKYEFYADKLWEIADKFQGGIGYDYDAALERCRKKQGKKPRDEDVGGEALAMGLLKAQQAAEAKAKKAAEKDTGGKAVQAEDSTEPDPWEEDF